MIGTQNDPVSGVKRLTQVVESVTFPTGNAKSISQKSRQVTPNSPRPEPTPIGWHKFVRFVKNDLLHSVASKGRATIRSAAGKNEQTERRVPARGRLRLFREKYLANQVDVSRWLNGDNRCSRRSLSNSAQFTRPYVPNSARSWRT